MVAIRHLVVPTALLLMAGCAGESRGLLTQSTKIVDGNATVTFLAITTRMPAPDDQVGHLFNGEREPPGRLNFSILTLSLPPGRKPGDLPVDASNPDPAKHITFVSAQHVDSAGAAGFLGRELAKRPAGARRALIFTHGYNTRFDRAAVRFAQIVSDTGFKGVPVLFSWPSRGKVGAYVYDRDSANYSRDAFERALTLIAHRPRLLGMEVFAHSMGNWLTLETLRGASIAGNRGMLGKVDTVVLAAPDVDMDVFRTQVRRLDGLQRKFVLYASGDDRALRISRKLAGGKIRAGELTDVARFRELGVKAQDLTSVEGGVGKNHGKAFGDAKTIAAIGELLKSDDSGDSASEGADALVEGITVLGDGMVRIGRAVIGKRD
ncbi:MAG: alpha/beta hydrolase [Sphingomonadales bacterium]|nr:alpha/beta hydrolase [Sphingomonadales bacterium]